MDAINFQSAVARMQAAQAARAYGQPRSNQPTQPDASPTQQVTPQAPQLSPARARIVSQLVAATVPGGVDFGAGTSAAPRPSAVIAMYRHPADRNTAATGVAMNAWPGRTIDVEG